MTSVLMSLCGTLHIVEKCCKSGFNKVYSGLKFVNGRAMSTYTDCKQVASPCRLVLVKALNNNAEQSNEVDGSDKKESSQNKDDELNKGMYREGLERLIGQDDSTFNGVDLATLIRNIYGGSYDVQLV